MAKTLREFIQQPEPTLMALIEEYGIERCAGGAGYMDDSEEVLTKIKERLKKAGIA